MAFENWKKLPEWVKTNKLFHKDLVKGGPLVPTTPDKANLVSSEIYTDANGVKWHYPIIDLDIPCHLEPSSTPGHGHLYLGKPVSHEAYGEILRVLNKHGLVQNGIIEHQFNDEGMTCARLPGIKKESDSLSSGGKGFANVPTATLINSEPGTFSDVEIDNTLSTLIANKVTVLDKVVSVNSEPVPPKQLTGDLKHATLLYEHLVHMAAKNGQSIKEVVDGWVKLATAFDDKSPTEKVVAPMQKPTSDPENLF